MKSTQVTEFMFICYRVRRGEVIKREEKRLNSYNIMNGSSCGKWDVLSIPIVVS